MSDSLKQTQKAGDHSTNVQGESVELHYHHHGLTLAEVRQEFLDLFEANFYRLQSVARETAQQRATEITEKFLVEMSLRNPSGLQACQDPDMQAAIFTAQREYARKGDKDLSELLVDILVDRAAQGDRNLKQIVLDESLTVAPKLTAEQYDILSLSFIVRHTRRPNLRTLQDFINLVAEVFLPFCGGIPKHISVYQHLQYSGCAVIEIGEISFAGVMYQHYSGLFSKGFAAQECAAIISPDKWIGTLFIPCLHNPMLFQVNALCLDDIVPLCERLSFPSEYSGTMRDLQQSHFMSQPEIEAFMRENIPGSGALIDLWNSCPLKSLTLTSVGIAIGHANIRRKTKREDYDLNIWIPD
jgi:hypothetical protein